MPRAAVPPTLRVAQLTGGKSVWSYLPSSNKILCQPCSHAIQITDKIKFYAESHAKSQKHKNNVEARKMRQSFITDQAGSSNCTNAYFQDMAKSFLKANIPFNKIEVPAFKSFLERHTGKTSLTESTLQKFFTN